MEEEDRAVLEEEESVGTQGESLADGVGVIEVVESPNKLGPEANIGRKAHHADASDERGG